MTDIADLDVLLSYCTHPPWKRCKAGYKIAGDLIKPIWIALLTVSGIKSDSFMFAFIASTLSCRSGQPRIIAKQPKQHISVAIVDEAVLPIMRKLCLAVSECATLCHIAILLLLHHSEKDSVRNVGFVIISFSNVFVLLCHAQ